MEVLAAISDEALDCVKVEEKNQSKVAENCLVVDRVLWVLPVVVKKVLFAIISLEHSTVQKAGI